MKQCFTAYQKSPIGYLRLTGSDEGVARIEFTDLTSAPHSNVPPCLRACFQQLDDYFQHKRTKFHLKLNPAGTEFQQTVWHELLTIPFGKTASYLTIAKAIGKQKAIRAVGAANGRNPIPIVIPCHRVIGSDGSLIGFGGGIWRKEFLLKHENVFLL